MAIKNRRKHSLFMDFSSMYDENNHPSDIDMFYMGHLPNGNHIAIFGEIKGANATISRGQQELLEHLAEDMTIKSMVLLIRHYKDPYEVDRVDVSECLVEKAYVKQNGRWRWIYPEITTTVGEVIAKYGGEYGRG